MKRKNRQRQLTASSSRGKPASHGVPDIGFEAKGAAYPID